jgi:hypothetical protein
LKAIPSGKEIIPKKEAEERRTIMEKRRKLTQLKLDVDIITAENEKAKLDVDIKKTMYEKAKLDIQIPKTAQKK